MKTILVAEDEPEVRGFLDSALRRHGYEVEFAEDGEEALLWLDQGNRDVSLLLLDMMMPRKNGLETLREIRSFTTQLPVIMLSGRCSSLEVVEAFRNGANDFLTKPVEFEELGEVIRKTLACRGLENGVDSQPAASAASPHSEPEAFLGAGTWSYRIDQLVRQVAASDVPVLLLGETGVGKEVVARRLHARSSRAAKPFFKVNCAALPSELIESELFGYERGAFTGAFKANPGKFEMANGGVLMLDEIGDMDVKLQAKLLQVLQDKEFLRLGSKEPTRVDVRVMAATHCNLEKAIAEGRFREDLYYRLNVVSIAIAPLRERKDEIIPLAEYFLEKYQAPGEQTLELTAALRKALLAHDWPGNVRELENIIRRYLVLRDPDWITQDIRFRSRKHIAPQMPRRPGSHGGVEIMPSSAVVTEAQPNGFAFTADGQAAPIGSFAGGTFSGSAFKDTNEPAAERVPPGGSVLEKVDQAKREAEATAILTALNATRWNRRQCAALLNIDYKALLYKMRKLRIGADENAKKPIHSASSN